MADNNSYHEYDPSEDYPLTNFYEGDMNLTHRVDATSIDFDGDDEDEDDSPTSEYTHNRAESPRQPSPAVPDPNPLFNYVSSYDENNHVVAQNFFRTGSGYLVSKSGMKFDANGAPLDRKEKDSIDHRNEMGSRDANVYDGIGGPSQLNGEFQSRADEWPTHATTSYSVNDRREEPKTRKVRKIGYRRWMRSHVLQVTDSSSDNEVVQRTPRPRTTKVKNYQGVPATGAQDQVQVDQSSQREARYIDQVEANQSCRRSNKCLAGCVISVSMVLSCLFYYFS